MRACSRYKKKYACFHTCVCFSGPRTFLRRIFSKKIYVRVYRYKTNEQIFDEEVRKGADGFHLLRLIQKAGKDKTKDGLNCFFVKGNEDEELYPDDTLSSVLEEGQTYLELVALSRFEYVYKTLRDHCSYDGECYPMRKEQELDFHLQPGYNRASRFRRVKSHPKILVRPRIAAEQKKYLPGGETRDKKYICFELCQLRHVTFVRINLYDKPLPGSFAETGQACMFDVGYYCAINSCGVYNARHNNCQHFILNLLDQLKLDDLKEQWNSPFTLDCPKGQHFRSMRPADATFPDFHHLSTFATR